MIVGDLAHWLYGRLYDRICSVYQAHLPETNAESRSYRAVLAALSQAGFREASSSTQPARENDLADSFPPRHLGAS